MQKKIIEDLKKHIKTKYTTCYAAMITGSFLTDRFNEFSDIDVVLFISNRHNVINETFSFENYKIQTIIIPITRIEEIIWVDYMECNGAIVRMFSSGKPLIERNSFVLDLIRFSKELYKYGGRKFKFTETKAALIKITSLLNDLKGNNNIDDNIFCAYELIEKTTELYLKFHGKWAGKGKYRMICFKESFPDLAEILITSYKDYFQTKNSQNLINFISNTLNNFNGEKQYFSVSNYYNHFSNYYIVQLQDLDKEILSFFSEYNYFYYSHYPLIGTHTQEVVFLILPITSQQEYEKLDKKISKYFTSTSKVHYPIEFNPFFKIGLNINNTILSEILIEIKNIINNNGIRNNESKIILSLIIINSFIDILFEDNEFKKIEFIDFVYNELLILTAEDVKINKLNEFKKEQVFIQKKFFNQYKEQKKYIKENFFEHNLNTKHFESFLKENFKCFLNIDDFYFYRNEIFGNNSKNNFFIYKEILLTILRSTTLKTAEIAYILYIYKTNKNI